MFKVFVILFILTSAVAYSNGVSKGKNSMKEKIEDAFTYVTIKDVEDMAENMRNHGASDDDVIVLALPEWWENKEE